jgi:hypothetical protein
MFLLLLASSTNFRSAFLEGDVEALQKHQTSLFLKELKHVEIVFLKLFGRSPWRS